ncbi:MAG: hypothetical protein NTW04_04470 [Elusimicrobia bacterium]|nr:hypothetical protein [Elusimicrobiota bacterium]
MFKIIRRIIWVLCVHFIFFVCFPDTGHYGMIYGWLSVTVWTAAAVFATTMLNAVNKFVFALIADIMLIGMIGFSLAFTMPQSDKVHPYKKIIREQYPDQMAIKRGLLKFGITPPDMYRFIPERKK